MPSETVLVIDDSPTILKVVQLVLTKAGFQVETAKDGEAGLEAARAVPPDVILLDFVMPRMNGYQFCREMANDDGLKDIPVVLMSAKGDQVGERFVKVMGIVDYITKPFSPEAITAVVQHTISKYAQCPQEEYSQPLIRGSHDVGPSDAERQATRDQEQARKNALNAARTQIAHAVSARIAGLFSLAAAAREDGESEESKVPTDASAIADAAGSALDDAVLLEILAAAEPAQGASLRGDLSVVPITEVLQLLDAQEQSGILSVSRAKGQIEIYYRKGRVDLAVATGVSEEFLLGRFIIDGELMTQQDFEGFLESRGEGSKLIGAQLVKLGYLNEQDLRSALQRQTCELIYEMLRWSHGSFRFHRTHQLPPAAVDASLELDVEGILMEGFRRVDEWHLIEREVENFDLVFLRNEDAVAQMGRGRLTREELAVLELVNGKNTVKDIIRRSRMGSFDVSKMLYRLLSIKLIRRRVMPVAV
jgi:DNA-binding response OmpR family regulator